MLCARAISSSRSGAAIDDLQQEAILLGLGERISAFVFDGVLRGEYGEVRGERVGFAINGDGALLHGLQQSGLRFRGSAVDFVGQQEGSKHRPAHQGELAAAQVEDVGAGDVGGHQIGSELNAREVAAQHAGQRSDQQRLRDAGHALNQCVLAGQDHDEGLVHYAVLAQDDFRHLGPRVVDGLM